MFLMSVAELAEYLGESRRTIYRYLQSGDCPRYIRLSARNLRFDKRDVDAWLESKKVTPGSREAKP
jgi:excisionase family DNA binding protein